MTTKKLPLHLENTFMSFYAKLGERIAAAFLDGLFLVPLTVGMLYFNSVHLYNFYYTFVITQLVIMVYCTYLPVRYGATPGKRVMGLTILRIDGAAITYREAFLKYAPMLAVGLISFVFQCVAISGADAATYDSLSWLEQTKYLKEFTPLPSLQLFVVYAYYIATVIMVLADERKRSLSDVIAGTVVVYTRCLDKITPAEDEIEELAN